MHTVLSFDANVIAATFTNSFTLKYQILFMNFRVTHIVKPRRSLLFLKYGMSHKYVSSRVAVITERDIKKILFSGLYRFSFIEFLIFNHIRVLVCVSRISHSSLVLPVFGLHDLSSVSESLWYTCSWKGTDADDDYQ